MKNLDSKMRVRFHRREQDEDRTLRIQLRQLEKNESKAEAEAKANRLISESITPELIQMKEAEARMEHGWVEVQGASSVVTTE